LRIPAPAALLVEHPAVPVPRIDGGAKESVPGGTLVPSRSLSRRERFNAALQLTAAVSLLAEFDLWPGMAAIRNSVFVRSSSGIQACLGRFPVTMSRVFARLGGGEAAAAKTRAAAIESISEVVGLPRVSIDVGKGEPGYFLEGAISRQLRELKRPLDRSTARALWAFRWDGLPTPDVGGTDYWTVPVPDLARRLGGALWAEIRRGGGRAWLRAAGDHEEDSSPAPATDATGVLILVGEISSDDLAAVTRWTLKDECSATLIGGFPRGWHPPPAPGFDNRNLHRHFAVTGMPLEEARRVVETRIGRIEALELGDRRAITAAGRRIFAPSPERVSADRTESKTDRLRHLLSLAPDGLPTGFVVLHSGLTESAIEDRRRELAIVGSGGRLRLADCPPLERDPMHRLIADLYGEEDPKRLLHRALGNGEADTLEAWARIRLDRLDGYAVRDLLSVLSPGALGQDIGALLVEACLAVFDISGARRALTAIPRKRGDALRKWLDGIDDRSGWQRQLPRIEQLAAMPRTVGEVALLVLKERRTRGVGDETEPRELIERARELVPDLVRRRFDIELAWIADDGDLEDPAWRRRVVGENPVLKAQYAHRRARQLMDARRPRSARRLLAMLSDDRIGPGFLGIVELDLGAAALDAGESRAADTHQLRAYRLLEAAGFQHVTRRVLFNLAVADLDQLEIARADQRFADLSEEDPEDPFLAGELTRLVLAKGDLAQFRALLKSFEERVDADDPRFAEALRFLKGVDALFNGELARAHGLLQAAGQEGEVWTGLVDTVAGRDAASWQPDGWGVSLAAELIHDAAGDLGRVAGSLESERMTRPRALAAALAEQVGRARLPITEALRIAAVQVLRDGGMNGWADALASISFNERSIVEAMAEIVDHAGPEGLTSDLGERLLIALGVGGLEIRSVVDGRVLWSLGSGVPGAEIRHGRVIVVPLGGEAHDTPAWRLLTGIFDLFAPAGAAPSERDVEETGFYGISAAAVAVRRELGELGPTHLPILLVGETGVGKEVAARALHRLSRRRGAFVPVNVAAIPANLLEAELFGSVKGAYTGADRSRQGLTVAADGGTLFLDEVGDLDPPLQVKLLRFLEDQEVRAVGATHSKSVDVRIISATHQDLDRRVREGGFRQDLYYRIAAPPLIIPPLRDRRQDIPLLRDLFERDAENRHGMTPPAWSSEAEAVLNRHPWPGNVRELRQAVEVAMVRAAGSVVRPEHLPITEPVVVQTGTWEDAQRDFRRSFLRAALERNGGNRSATARELGISRQALLYHLRNLGISNRGDR
jgi:transcriptional regulator with AAA-type ATPase domain